MTFAPRSPAAWDDSLQPTTGGTSGSPNRLQGALTDLRASSSPAATSTAVTVGDAATAIRRARDESTKLRVFFELIRGADEAGTAAGDLAVDEPPLADDTRFDALLAAAGEYICARIGRAGPPWTMAPDRFLDNAWWISDLPSVRAFAAVWTPASFRRRGIYLDRHDLSSDAPDVRPAPAAERNELYGAFRRLAEQLERKHVAGQVHVAGGTAMLLAFKSRIITRDVAALFAPEDPMLAAIHEIATEMSWPPTWLNNQAPAYVSRADSEGGRVFDHPNLQVAVTPAAHVLAMKVVAARSVGDREDIVMLLDQLHIAEPTTVWEIVTRYFPNTGISERSRLLVEDILGCIR